MDKKSPFELAKDLQMQVNRLLSGFDRGSLPSVERELLVTLQRQVAEARLDIRDYGLAETAASQQALASMVRRRLGVLEQSIVQAGALSVFGPADVAQLSAITQQLMSDL